MSVYAISLRGNRALFLIKILLWKKFASSDYNLYLYGMEEAYLFDQSIRLSFSLALSWNEEIAEVIFTTAKQQEEAEKNGE